MARHPTISDYMSELEHPRRSEIDRLRHLIRQAVPEAVEQVKWNAPSYSLPSGLDCLTFRLHPAPILQLILHRGARTATQAVDFADPAGLITWVAPDRGVLDFARLDPVAQNADLTDLIRRWLAAYSLK